MSQYMLDTDTCSYIMNRDGARTARKLQEHEVKDVFISAITKSELEFGIEVSPHRDKDKNALAVFLQHVAVLDYPSDAALDYAQIRAYLKKKGTPIGANDLFIAAHSRCLGMTMVTNNMREFSRVPGLKVENWT